jgi:hypothetical protein
MGMLAKKTSGERDSEHRQARLGLSKATWGNIIATRYEEQKTIGWEMAVRIEKIIVTVLHEAHERQTEEVIDILSEGPESFYARPSE